ncbi:tRNA epoxyqueuosine(34) reductase QueG [Mucisphaera sp.]|uniref:tRNA epoxyqueuosine(34) reductase QueG n=1 Tax=Mucisphaera sp. TaxID=2913024 RepID=UPI003D0F49C5
MTTNPAQPHQARQRALDLAADLGFALAAVTDAQPSAHTEHVRQWITDGKHAEMTYLEKNLDTRLDPTHLLPGCQSILCVADAYHPPQPPQETSPSPDNKAKAETAAYAAGRDYHKVMKKKLHRLADALREQYPDHTFRATVDTAPILEREHAARAGLGWIGKHTLLIHPRHGSYLLLGCLLTNLPMQTCADAGYPTPAVPPDDHCGTCTRCIDACPTQCITPYSVDAANCISYLTLEHRSDFTPKQAAALSSDDASLIAGCDICQQVCPHNTTENRIPLPIRDDYTPRPHANGLDPAEVIDWTESDRLRHLAGTALTRMSLAMLHRNAQAILDHRDT